jgi:hypothetical protein
VIKDEPIARFPQSLEDEHDDVQVQGWKRDFGSQSRIQVTLR